MMEIINTTWSLTCEMSPYLLLGFFLAGLMHEFVPGNIYSRYLSRPNFMSVLYATLVGIPLPLCSCGVIPTAMGLRREGASRGATVAFLTATPQTGVDSIIATYSMMGLPFALIRPFAALATAIFGGTLQNVFSTDEDVASTAMQQQNTHRKKGSLVGVLRYAFVEMMGDIGKWLVIGLIIAGLITALVPDNWFAVFQDNSLLSILFVLALSVPMYLCATGSIPIAVALMLKGLTPGAAFVLLMAGPASNMASILVIRKVLGTRSLILYLTSILFGAIAFGLSIDYLCPSEWFVGALHHTLACCHGQRSDLLGLVCSVILILMLINALTPLHFFGHQHCHCGCHCHEDSSDCEDECQTDAALKFEVKGMNCSHCSGMVHDTIAALPGVSDVEVSLERKEALVHGSRLDVEAICKAVEAVGFDITTK